MKSYISGFVLSILLTLTAFGLVFWHISSQHISLPHTILVPSIIILAVLQLIVQLVFFIHLGHEEKPKLNLMAFLFMLLVVVILVAGSLWIMANLNYNMHSMDMDKYIIEDEGIHTH